MSLTINDIMQGASDPGQAIANYVGNLQVGGNTTSAPTPTSGTNGYQFNPGSATTPVAPSASPYSLTAPTGTAPAPQMQMPLTGAPQMQPQMQPQGLQAPMPQPMAPQMQPSAAPAPIPQPMNMAGTMAQPIPNAPVSPQQAQQVMNQPQGAVAQPAVYTPPSNQMQPTTPQGGNVYGNMIQAESNGQNFNAQGQPLTSPAGAMFAAQVMPGTAANPGYGIKPAAAQTPEEYNRVGREYYNAMYNKFQGDPYKAAAAYNAGPGRVDRAIAEAKEKGGDYRDYLPAETRAYLDKIQGNHAQISQVALQTKPSPEASDDMHNTLHTDHFVANQNRYDVKSNYAFSDQAPIMVQKAANEQLSKDLDHTNKIEQAQKIVESKLASGDTSDFARALVNNDDKGSYIKAYLFHRFGLNDLAKNEQQKLGAGNQWQSAVDSNGQRALINYDGNNMPISGYDQTGRKLTGNELANFAASAVPMNKAETTAEVYYDPTKPTSARFNLVKTPMGGRFVEAGTNRLATPEEQNRLVKMSAGGPLEQQAMAAYLTHGFGQQGTQAAQGYQNAPLPAAPGSTQGRMQIQGGAQPQVPTPTTAAQPGAAPAPTPPSAAPIAPTQPNVPVYQQQQQAAVSGEEQKSFLKDKTDFANNAGPGAEVANIRRNQISNLMNDPQIMGYLAAEPTSGGKFAQFIREVVAGAYDKDEGKKLADDLRTSGLPIPLQDKIKEYQQANTRINALTLKSNEGPGSISNAEQRMNQNANMTNIGDLGPWSALTGLGKHQLVGDMTVAKQQFAAQHPELNTATKFQDAWSKQYNTIMNSYEGIYQARLSAVKPYYDAASNPANRNNVEVQKQYRNASVAAFKTYPTPDYNPQTGKWDYKTKEAKMAAMRAIAGGQ